MSVGHTEWLDVLAEVDEAEHEEDAALGLPRFWRTLLPHHFGDFFEVFTFLAHLRWHKELRNLVLQLTPAGSDKEGRCQPLVEMKSDPPKQLPWLKFLKPSLQSRNLIK